MNQENEYYDGGDVDIDIEKLNELEKENFDNNFESIISFEVKDTPKFKDEKDNLALSTSTSASSDENPLIKFNSLKTKIEELEKEVKTYSESQNLIEHNETLDEYFERIKKLKETLNFISNSQNFYELKKIIDSNKNNEKNIDKYKILQMKMIENLNMHLINRANIINQLKSENPEEYNNLDYELYITPESKKIKKITKILEIKNKLNKIKERLGNIEVQNDKENLLSIVKDLKEKIKIQDIDFKKKIEEQKNLINKRVKEMDINTDFYDILDKEYLDALFFGFKSSEEIENIINETVTKMESLKDRHEISAFVGLKLQEMIEQQVKLGNEIVDNSEILINLKKNIKNNVEVMKKNLELLKTKLGVK
jgi:hypothetical protein